MFHDDGINWKSGDVTSLGPKTRVAILSGGLLQLHFISSFFPLNGVVTLYLFLLPFSSSYSLPLSDPSNSGNFLSQISPLFFLSLEYQPEFFTILVFQLGPSLLFLVFWADILTGSLWVFPAYLVCFEWVLWSPLLSFLWLWSKIMSFPSASNVSGQAKLNHPLR